MFNNGNFLWKMKNNFQKPYRSMQKPIWKGPETIDNNLEVYITGVLVVFCQV